jgi:hypothetical protein
MSDASALPNTLYHYSGVDGIRGIIGSKILWASDWRYARDRTEFSYPRQVLARVAERMSATTTSDAARWVLDTIAGSLARADSGMPLYVACLCADGDLTRQWSDYAEDSTGFAVGLDRAELYEVGVQQGYSLGYLIYDESKQEALLEERLTEAIALVPQYANVAGSPVDPRLLFGLGITLALTDIKNPRFSEEHEWRLMWPQVRIDMSPPVKQRGTPGIPYLEFVLENSKTGRCLITEVVAGPSATPASVDEMRRLLDRQGLGHVAVRRSTLSP